MSEFKSWKQPIQITPPWDNTGTRTIRATANQLKQFFGLNENARWPEKGLGPIKVQGITLYVRPLGRLLDPVPPYYRKYMREGMNNRLMAVCPTCARKVSYGRLHQHLIVHHEKGEK